MEPDRGYGIPWQGNYSSWLKQKEARLAKEARSQTLRQKTLSRELKWIKMTAKNRRTRNKARLKAYETLLNQDSQKAIETLKIFIPPGPRLGSVAMSLS